MIVDTTLSALESAATEARTAEAYGYEGAFTGEVSNDPFLPLVLAAASTERIELGTSIAVAFSRSPVSLAYTAYDLQRFSRGRFLLGLGSQVKAHITRRFSMPWGRPAAQMREFVLAMQATWRSWTNACPLDFQGEYYRLTLMPPNFVPPGHEYGPPKVLIAGVGEAMTRVAGEVADGFLCHGFTTGRWIRERTIPALAEGRRRAGQSMEGFAVKAAVYLATGTDEQIDRSREAIRSHIAFYASTPAYRPVLELHGWGDVGAELTTLSKQGRWAEMSHLIDDHMLDEFAIVAPLHEVPDRLAQRFAGMVNRVSFISQEPSLELLDAVRSVEPP
jgi:probable F420-dependent oxidoreductase